MKTLPSKELLSEVLGVNVKFIEFDIETIKRIIHGSARDNDIYYYNGKWKFINIYELASKCKEWASSKGYVIIQDTRGYTKAYRFPNGEIKFWEDENMDLTIDRIIQACEWIMERTK